MVVYRRFCMFVFFLFLLNSIYPLTVKMLEGRLAGDWLHSLLHLFTALVAAYSWRSSNNRLPQLFTWGLGVFYLALGVLGFMTPGLLLQTPFALPLGIADNVFHLLVVAIALAAVAANFRVPRRLPL